MEKFLDDDGDMHALNLTAKEAHEAEQLRLAQEAATAVSQRLWTRRLAAQAQGGGGTCAYGCVGGWGGTCAYGCVCVGGDALIGGQACSQAAKHGLQRGAVPRRAAAAAALLRLRPRRVWRPGPRARCCC